MNSIPIPNLKQVVVLLLCSLVVGLRTHAGDMIWSSPGGGDWAVAANWTPSQVPGPSDNAILALNATVTVSSAVAVSNLVFSAGTIAGGGILTIGGTMTWTAGTMQGNGTTLIQPGAHLLLSGPNDKTLNQRTLDNAGTLAWIEGTWWSGGTATIRNEPTGVIRLEGDHALSFNGFGARSEIDNLGVVRKTAGTGVSRFDAALNNDGTLAIDTGTVEVAAGGLSHGMFSAASGSTLVFGGGTMTLDPSATVVSAGSVNFTGGRVHVNGHYEARTTLVTSSGNVGFNGSATVNHLTLNSGTLEGTGMLRVEESMQWTGGTMQGSGTTTIQPAASLILSGPNDKTLNQRTLENTGTLIWLEGAWLSGATATILNQPTGVIDLQGDRALSFNGYGSPSRVQNHGLLKKGAGTGTSLLDIAFNNDGTLLVQSGTVSLTRNGDHHGVFDVRAGASLNLSGGTMTMQDGVSLGGAGLIQCAGSTVNVVGNVSASVNTLALSGGAIGGGGTLAVGGSLAWTGGTMQGTGTTAIQPGASLILSGPNDKTLNQRTLDNAGTLAWIDGTWWSGGTAIIRNEPTGVIDLLGDDALSFNGFGARSQIQNLGVLRKTAGAGVSLLDLPVSNQGTLEARSGQLQVTGNLSQGANSVIAIQIGGPGPDARGQLTVGAAAQLAGTLSVSLTGGFKPSPGEAFEIVKFGSHTGTLEHITGLTTADGLYLDPTVSPTHILLTTLDSRPSPTFNPVKVLPNHQLQITLTGVAGDRLVIFSTTDLSVPIWTPFLTNENSALGFSFIESDTTRHPQRFFRAERSR